MWPNCVAERKLQGFDSVAGTNTAADIKEES